MDSALKIIVVGARAVGKTSFIQRYVNAVFSEHYKTTIGVDFSLKVIMRNGRRIKLNFWDISGQEYVVSMTRVYYKDAHAAIIMFDLTDTASFDMCAKWKKDIDAKCSLADGSPLPVMLIANKVDLQKLRSVDKDAIEEFVKQNKITCWSEVSVKQDVYVNESVEMLLEELLANEASRLHSDERRPAEEPSSSLIHLPNAAAPAPNPSPRPECPC